LTFVTFIVASQWSSVTRQKFQRVVT